jgi:hypothetical protein
MSFMNYVERKKNPKIITNMDNYKNILQSEFSSLVLKPNFQSNEIKKNIVNIYEISKILYELSYQFSEELKMAIRTGDPVKINEAHKNFSSWAKSNKKNKDLTEKIETILFNYQTKLYDEKILPEDIDKIVDFLVSESQIVLDQISQKIFLGISQIPSWRNYQITIEALIPEKDWIVNEAKITIGENFKTSFVYKKNFLGHEIKNIEESEVPERMSKNIKLLIETLNSNSKNNRVLTLFMNRPFSERHYYETIKKDLSLGIKSVLPQHIVLSDYPLETDEDVWKVKLEEKYIQENNFKKYIIVENEAPIIWIERINNEN